MNIINNLIATACRRFETINTIFSTSSDIGLYVADEFPSSLVPSRPEYDYLDPATKEGAKALITPKEGALQKKINQVFHEREETQSLEQFVGTKKSITAKEGFPIDGDEIIVLKKNPFVFLDPKNFPEYVLKAKGNFLVETNKFCVDGLYPANIIGRASMAHTMRKIVKQENFDQLYVVKKILAHIPNASYKLDDANYLIVAEKLDLTNSEETKEIFQNMGKNETETLLTQLYTLFVKSGYPDGHQWNFAFIKSGPQKGKLAIYDTEPLATFQFRNYVSLSQEMNLDPHYCKEKEKNDVVFGTTRSNDLICAKWAISETLSSVQGLPIADDIKKPIAEKFLKKIEEELRSIELKSFLYFTSPVIVAISAVALQCLLIGIDYTAIT